MLCSDDQVEKIDFLCPNPSCGDSPKYIVCDGKTDGPTKRKVEHLHELDKASPDLQKSTCKIMNLDWSRLKKLHLKIENLEWSRLKCWLLKISNLD